MTAGLVRELLLHGDMQTNGLVSSIGALTAIVLGGCGDEPTSPADRMRDAYVPTERATVGGLSWQVEVALAPDVVYGAGSNRLVQVARGSGQVTELLTDAALGPLYNIAADAARVYVVVGGRDRIVAIPEGGGAPVEIFAVPGGTISTLTRWGEALYALASVPVGDGYTDRLFRIPVTGDAPTVIAETPSLGLAGFAVAADGVYVGRLGARGSVVRIPHAGGEAVVVQESARFPRNLIADGTGVYWTLVAGDIGDQTPAQLYFMASGSAAPTAIAATTTRAAFAVNDLGFYWVDYDHRAILAIAREDLTSAPFTMIATGDAPLGVAADADALVYSTDDGDDDLGDLVLHVLPRQP